MQRLQKKRLEVKGSRFFFLFAIYLRIKYEDTATCKGYNNTTNKKILSKAVKPYAATKASKIALTRATKATGDLAEIKIEYNLISMKN